MINDNEINVSNSVVLNSRTIDNTLSIKLIEVHTQENSYLYIVRTQLMAWDSKPVIKEYNTLAKAVNHYDKITSAFSTFSNKINAALHANLMSKYNLFSETPTHGGSYQGLGAASQTEEGKRV